MAELKYRIRFFFEYNGGGCLWADSDAAYEAFGFGPIDTRIAEKFPALTNEILEEILSINKWHSENLDQQNPAAPVLWKEEECVRFNAAVDLLLEKLRGALRADFEIANVQTKLAEERADCN